MNETTDKGFAVSIALVGPGCLLMTWAIGACFHFDGQAAVLTLPFVILFWLFSLGTIFWGFYRAVWGASDRRTRIVFAWCSLANLVLVCSLLALGLRNH